MSPGLLPLISGGPGFLGRAGTKLQSSASAATTRGSVQVFGQSLTHVLTSRAPEAGLTVAAAGPASVATGSRRTGGSDGGAFSALVQARRTSNMSGTAIRNLRISLKP